MVGAPQSATAVLFDCPSSLRPSGTTAFEAVLSDVDLLYWLRSPPGDGV